MNATELLKRYADGERDFRGANLRGANLRGTGVLQIHTTYEVTAYPDGRLTYGCETRHVDEWPRVVDELAVRHEPDRAADYVAEITAILALVRVMTTRRIET